MKNKGKKFIIGVILAAYGVIGLFGMFGETQDKSSLLLGSILFIAAGAALIFLDKKFPKQQKTVPEVSNASSAPVKPVIPDGEMNYNLFYDVTNNCVLCYEYEENLFLLDGTISYFIGNGGKLLNFVSEPNNEYDDKAIAVYFNKDKVGYVYKGKIQDMINDWISRGDYFFGYINKFSIANSKVSYKIGFYKSLNRFENKMFRLTKIGKKVDDDTTRKDNLLLCNPGEVVTIEADIETGNLIVLNDAFEEIGELPKNATEFISAENYKTLVGIIENIDTDDEDKTEADIVVYLIK